MRALDITASQGGAVTIAASKKPRWSAHRTWDLIVHPTAELDWARLVLGGAAGPWIEGETTWPTVTDTSVRLL